MAVGVWAAAGFKREFGASGLLHKGGGGPTYRAQAAGSCGVMSIRPTYRAQAQVGHRGENISGLSMTDLSDSCSGLGLELGLM